MKLLLDSHVPAGVAATVLKLKPSWKADHVSSWQGRVWRNVDDDLRLEDKALNPGGVSASNQRWR